MEDIEYHILDELYFVSSFQNLMDNLSDGLPEAGEKKDLVTAALKSLLEKGFVNQVKMKAGKEEKLEVPDFRTIEESYFVASKKGLLIHNSRN